jgi:hypothetical protein
MSVIESSLRQPLQRQNDSSQLNHNSVTGVIDLDILVAASKIPREGVYCLLLPKRLNAPYSRPRRDPREVRALQKRHLIKADRHAEGGEDGL